MSLLLNGSPVDSFTPSKGLQQGDLLSLYLFILCMEVLSAMLNQSMENGKIKGIKITHSGTGLSHLLFADDLILMGMASQEEAVGQMNTIQKFGDCLGQKVNLSKSHVHFSNNFGGARVIEILNTLGLKKMPPSAKYLGLLMFFSKSKSKDLSFLLDCI